ncbi:hypothetical protein [Microbacterium arborescens]
MTTPTEEPSAKRSRPRTARRNWWIAGVALFLVAGTAAVAVPAIAGQIGHDAAFESYSAAIDAATAAHKSSTAKQANIAAAVAEATSEADAMQAVIDATPADLVEPATTRDDLAAAIQAVRDATASPVPATEPLGDWAEHTRQASKTQLADAAKTATTYTSGLKEVDVALHAAEYSISEGRAALRGAVDALAAAAATRGAALGADKAGESERAALEGAVSALTSRDVDQPLSDTGAQLSAYVAAATAARASHDAAAEQEASAPGMTDDRDSSTRSGSSNNGRSGSGGGSNGGGWSNGGGGDAGSSNSGGGGSNGGSGGGSNGGGSSGGGSSEPSCWGNQENACVKTPATFSTNGNYVGLHGGCAYYFEHNVGYGGNSRDGASLDFPWSASVSGPTVTYYICG